MPFLRPEAGKTRELDTVKAGYAAIGKGMQGEL
jgi:hypothetical protein